MDLGVYGTAHVANALGCNLPWVVVINKIISFMFAHSFVVYVVFVHCFFLCMFVHLFVVYVVYCFFSICLLFMLCCRLLSFLCCFLHDF